MILEKGENLSFLIFIFFERPLYVPALKNNSIKSHTSQYVVRIQKATSLCENIKVHLQSSENVELNNLGDIHTFFISLVPEKIGDLKCLIFVNLKLKKKDNLQKEFEKIVYFDVKSKVNMNSSYYLLIFKDCRKPIQNTRNQERFNEFR